MGDRIGTVDPALVVHSFRPRVIERLLNMHGVEEAKVKAVAAPATAGACHMSDIRDYASRVSADTIGARGYGIGHDLRAPGGQETWMTAVAGGRRPWPCPSGGRPPVRRGPGPQTRFCRSRVRAKRSHWPRPQVYGTSTRPKLNPRGNRVT